MSQTEPEHESTAFFEWIDAHDQEREYVERHANRNTVIRHEKYATILPED